MTQISQALVLTEQAASGQVCQVLAKSGATGRGEAAASAHRRDLDQR